VRGEDGQTKASVVNGDNGTPEPKVTGELYKWPTSRTPGMNESGYDRNYEWEDTKKRPPNYSARTFQQSASMDPHNLYYDDYTGACYPGVGSAITYDLFDNDRNLFGDDRKWFRIELRKAGFEPYFTYRRHKYGDRREVKDYGGNCSGIDCDSETTRWLPVEDWEQFKMWEHDENREKLPDLFPDPRAFAEGSDGRELECVDFDTPEIDEGTITESGAEVFGLRVRVSIANVGSGPFHVERPPIGTADKCPCPKGFKCDSAGDSEKCVAKFCDPEKSPSDDVCPRDMTCRDIVGDETPDERCALLTCSQDSDCDAPPTNGTCKRRGRCEDSGDFCTEDTPAARCICQKFNETPDVCDPTTTQVIQRVARTDPWNDYPPRREDLDADLEHHEGHGHMHLGKVVEARLVDHSGNEIGGENNKISFNLYDVKPFDTEIQNEVQKNSSKQWPDFAHLDQGITPGYKDKYAPGYEGQGIIVGTHDKVENELASKTRYIEVSVDPKGEFIERTRSNNVVRAEYEFPEWQNVSCEVRRGCGDWDRYGDGKQHRICKKYLQWYCYDEEAAGSDHPLCDDVPKPPE
jgi:hypothetical protein